MTHAVSTDGPKRLLDVSPVHVSHVDRSHADLPVLDTIAARDPEIADRLAQAAVAVGAVGSAALGVAALARTAFAQDGASGLPAVVVDVLNFALTLEFLESEFYTRGIAIPALFGPSYPLAVFAQIQKHEAAHVALLRRTLGAAAIAKPTFDFTAGGQFGDVFSNPRTFAALAQVFEDTGVRAYKGQAATLIPTPAILTTALQIHSVEARHAAQVRRLRGQKGWITGNSRGDLPAATQASYDGDDNRFQFILAQPGGNFEGTTEAWDEPLTKAQVLAIVRPFVRS